MLQIQHAILDQALNKTEKEIEEETGKELLNPKNVLPFGKEDIILDNISIVWGLFMVVCLSVNLSLFT